MFTKNFFFNNVSGAVGGGWTPADLTGALYWLDAGSGVTTSGSNVTSWTDRISSSVFTTASSSKPTYSSSDSDFNNLPSVNFPKNLNFSDVFYLTGPSATYSGEDIFMWQVYLLRNSTAPDTPNNMTLSFTTNGSYNGYFSGEGSTYKNEFLFSTFSQRNQSTLTPLYDQSIFFFGRATSGSPNKNEIWDNQSSITKTVNPSTFLASGTCTFTVGKVDAGIEPGPYYQFNGKLAELGICFGTVTNSEITDLVNYITSKYNITPTP